MSNRGGTGGGDGGGGREPDGVVIPESVRRTIQNIREITEKQHSDEDIYSVLQECSMDPHDTAQKLLYLDTFHEVKTKRDRKKETSVKQGRGPRGGRGEYFASYGSPGTQPWVKNAVGRRSAAPRKENGVNHIMKRSTSSSFPAEQRQSSNAAPAVKKDSTLASDGLQNLLDQSSGLGISPQLLVSGVVTDSNNGSSVLPPGSISSVQDSMIDTLLEAEHDKSTPSSNQFPISSPSTSLSGVYSYALDPILAPSMTQHPGPVGTIKREVGSQRKAVEQIPVQEIKQTSYNNEPDFLNNENPSPSCGNSIDRNKPPEKSKIADGNQLSESLQPSSLMNNDEPLGLDSSGYESHLMEESVSPSKVNTSKDAQDRANCKMLPRSAVPNGFVTFPNHFKVPEALRSGLTFGSFDGSSVGTKVDNGNCGEMNSADAIESLSGIDEDAIKPLSSNEGISSTVQDDHFDHLDSQEHVLEKVKQSDDNVVPSIDSKGDHLEQDTMLIKEDHQSPSVQIAPSYGLGIVPSMQGNHLVHFDGHEVQSQDVSGISKFPSENSTTSSSASPNPPVQNSVAAAPQPFLIRPPYPPNFLPYGHYFSPYFLQPMHHFLGHNGIPQQPATGSAYLTPAATAAAVKYPLSQFKSSTGPGNLTIGLPPLYGSYVSPPVGLNQGQAVTSGSSSGKEDLPASQLKESCIFNAGPVSEVLPWIPPAGDISSVQLNSLYHLVPQGQHLTFSPAQAGHGPITGVYPPLQTVGASSTVNPLLQQSQTFTTTVETMGLPSVAYQPQLSQTNWNASY
ncbi:hypothetical protein K2173_015390 [Erythroxylum novogranatense]|uniref:GBF-interacting protein 1 N-terminal domain-containing protein n=1 Tax=Erythroxylum novogranatense TaxID=1862640 RepID=A0AAV8SSF2_9ROSI|nr:hypothetical protein K2173_015390 [Erythroxylum novogranatense]